MKLEKETQTIDPLEEKLRIVRLSDQLGRKLTNEYYADKLNRTNGAISQALSGHPNTETILARIHRHNNWLEKQIQKRKEKVAA